MRGPVTFTVSLIAVLAICMPVECEMGFLVRTRVSEDPLDSEPVIKNKIIASSRFWGKRSFPDELRRASLRWGKRWDPKVWKQSYPELLQPVDIVSPGWSAVPRTNDNSDDMAQEDDQLVFRPPMGALKELRRGCLRISWEASSLEVSITRH
ncbi:unnamed protein product [Cylicocyclus nassatus]|uniref:Uncharacterized protein n=1 Tax=Cylicocyclus nassatus TaxID=53992 RepID=A0AA36MGE9_CYLNA|nr:unnamed protein product [Cylicocyclus nassatus]